MREFSFRRRFIGLVFFFFALSALLGCGGGGGEGPPPEDLCSVTGQNAFVYDIMTDTYLWYDKVPRVNPANYSSPETLLNDVVYTERDRWSYITDAVSYDDLFEEGRFVGYGFYLKFDETFALRVAYVYEDSPASRAGFRRGVEVLAVNDKTVSEIQNNGLWGEIFGPDEIGVVSTFQLRFGDEAPVTRTLEKEVVTINTVLFAEIYETAAGPVGYLVFNRFLEPGREALSAVFDDFKASGVVDLILDLRYNGGGRLSVSLHLAALIGGEKTAEQIYSVFLHNDKYEHWNGAWFYPPASQSALNLDRVIVITTHSTCSASETVINGLAPFIEVIAVGGTTCGKPVGMYGYDFCGKHISPVEFEVVNANGEGGYYEGIFPVCPAMDELTAQLGDPDEGALKTAFDYLETGECFPAQTVRTGDAAAVPLQPFQQLAGFVLEIGSF